MRGLPLGVGIFPVVGFLCVACGGGNEPMEPEDPGPIEPVVTKSVALSPRGFPADFSDLLAFLEEAGSLPAGGVLSNSAWRDDVEGGSDAGTAPAPAVIVAGQAETYDYEPIVVFGWRTAEAPHIRVPANPVNDWRNEEAIELFMQMVEDFAADYEPPFLFLGNESDQYYAQDPEDYLRWVEVYERLYGAIKTASPETRVGPVFQYERMAGLGDLAGLEGPIWEAIDTHDLAFVDVVGLTVYPFFTYETPEEIPADYLSPLDAHIGDVPIAITESGWPAEHAEGFAAPWEASESLQLAYVEAMGRMLEDRTVRVVSWLYLHAPVQEGIDPQEWNIFQSLSLRRPDGSPRAVYSAWRDFSP